MDDERQGDLTGKADLGAEVLNLQLLRRKVAIEVEPDFAERDHLVLEAEVSELSVGRVVDGARIVRMDSHCGKDLGILRGQGHGLAAVLLIGAHGDDVREARFLSASQHLVAVLVVGRHGQMSV